MTCLNSWAPQRGRLIYEHRYLNWSTHIFTLPPFSNTAPSLPTSPLCSFVWTPPPPHCRPVSWLDIHHKELVCVCVYTKFSVCRFCLYLCSTPCVVKGQWFLMACLQTTCLGSHLSHHHQCPPEVPVQDTFHWMILVWFHVLRLVVLFHILFNSYFII